MAIEQMRSEGRSDEEIRKVVQHMKAISVERFTNRHKIGEMITDQNMKLLSASHEIGSQGPQKRHHPKLRNISVDYNKS